MLSLLLSFTVQAQQFRLVGNPSGFPNQVNDSTYTLSIDFAADQTGNSFLPTQIPGDGTYRIFFQNQRIYSITAVANATFSSADLTLVEYANTDGQPSGQSLVYDPQDRDEVPQSPSNSVGASPVLNAAIFTYNIQFDKTGGSGGIQSVSANNLLTAENDSTIRLGGAATINTFLSLLDKDFRILHNNGYWLFNEDGSYNQFDDGEIRNWIWTHAGFTQLRNFARTGDRFGDLTIGPDNISMISGREFPGPSMGFYMDSIRIQFKDTTNAAYTGPEMDANGVFKLKHIDNTRKDFLDANLGSAMRGGLVYNTSDNEPYYFNGTVFRSFNRSIEYNTVTTGSLSIKIGRQGGSAPNILTNSTGDYTLVIPAGANVLSLEITGNNSTVTGSGDFIIRVDNSANSEDKRFASQIYNAGNGAFVDPHAQGNNHTRALSSNILTHSYPNMQPYGAAGFEIILR